MSAVLCHSADLGDVIAAMPTLRALGGGRIIIGPIVNAPMRGRESLKGARFEALKPLLLAQPYVEGIEWQDDPRGFTHDLRDFRHGEQHGESLLNWQARFLGVAASDEPWLTVEPSLVSKGRTVIARSARYHNSDFPWKEVLQEHPNALFVGTEQEHLQFTREVGPTEYCHTPNLLNLAGVIAGADLFFGNQSCPFWIAAGLGAPLVQEMWMPSPNSIVQRKNARYLRRGPLHPQPTKRTEILKTPMLVNGPKLICVLSFCATDRLLALEVAKHIECLGGVSRHRCLLLHPNNVDAREIERHLKPAFESVRDIVFAPRLNGWPEGNNLAFYEAAKAVQEMPGNDPWLFMEADCVPTGPPWLDEISAEHQFHAQPMLGVFSDTFGNHGIVVGRNVEGVAVYPHDFLKRCPPLRYIVATTEHYLKQGQTPPAFNVYLSPYTTKMCAQATTIGHYWKSYDFKQCADGIVTCRYKIAHGVSDEVDMGASLVHGCKDHSLLDLVQERLAGATFPTLA